MELAKHEFPPPTTREGGRDSSETLKRQVEADLRSDRVPEKTIRALMENPADLGQLPAAFKRLAEKPDAMDRLQRLALESLQ